MKSATTVWLVIAFLLAGNVWAQDRPDDAAQIVPFINNFTLGIVRVEPAGIDFDALERWGEDVVKQSKMDPEDTRLALDGVKQQTQTSRKWTEEFKRAGGKSVWVVFTVENFPDDPVFVVVPLEKGADGPSLQRLLGGDNHVAQSRGALIVADNSKALDRVRAIMQQPRPELAKALAEAGDAKVRIALIPSDDARRVIESMVPNLSNGVNSESLTKGMLWAAVTITPPANVTLHGMVQSESNQAAQEFVKLMRDLAPAKPNEPAPLAFIADLVGHAKVNADRVVIDLDQNEAQTAATHLTGAVRQARIRAGRERSASNIRQIMMGMYLYANNHKGQFPDTLEQAATQADLLPAMLINPNRPDEKPGYVYIKPAEGVKAGAERVVVYEKYKPGDFGINLGYADGHVEFWQLKPAEEEIRKAREARPKP